MHATGFIGGASTREGVLAMAVETLHEAGKLDWKLLLTLCLLLFPTVPNCKTFVVLSYNSYKTIKLLNSKSFALFTSNDSDPNLKKWIFVDDLDSQISIWLWQKIPWLL